MVETVLRLKKVLAVTGKGKSQIYDDMKIGAFPRPIKTGKRAVAWLECDIADWQAARIRNRDEGERTK